MDVTEAECDLNDAELVNAVNALMEDLVNQFTIEGAEGTNININIIIRPGTYSDVVIKQHVYDCIQFIDRQRQ